jgi:hypothetical protein
VQLKHVAIAADVLRQQGHLVGQSLGVAADHVARLGRQDVAVTEQATGGTERQPDRQRDRFARPLGQRLQRGLVVRLGVLGVGRRFGIGPLRRGLGQCSGTACRAQPSHGPGADLRRLAICRGTNPRRQNGFKEISLAPRTPPKSVSAIPSAAVARSLMPSTKRDTIPAVLRRNGLMARRPHPTGATCPTPILRSFGNAFVASVERERRIRNVLSNRSHRATT